MRLDHIPYVVIGGDDRLIAGDILYALSFRRLRAIASSLLRSERMGHTLQPTALVHEGFLKLWKGSAVWLQDEEHFFCLAARAMKQALTDYGRCKTAAKRVNPAADEAPLWYMPGDPVPLIDARFALKRLHQLDPEVERTVRLRCIEGMTIEEAARVQGLEPWRVRQNYDFAVMWLGNKLRGER